jgi:CubicO group peptidase (beta-lactamase class C family)
MSSDRSRRRTRIAASLAAMLVLLPALAYGAAHLLTDRSTLARSVVWTESDIGDLRRFPSRTIPRARAVSPLPRGPADRKLPAVVADAHLAGETLDEFLARHATRAFVVVQRGELIYERYFNGGSASRLETSFSMAKSFASTLVGIAIDDGSIASVEDPITRYLPELARRDPRFQRIRVRHLLTMSSGLRYVEAGRPWSDDAVTYYGTDLREVALERTRIEGAPGRKWLYNNFNPLLLGLILERATGRKVADYMASRLWQPLEAEADASWSLDSKTSGFEKMESGVNARARDFARFGRLLLDDGRVGSRQVVSREWVREATRGRAFGGLVDFYGAMWWVRPQAQAARDPFLARGKYGQVIAVIPDRDIVMVRLGSDEAGIDWAATMLDLASSLAEPAGGASGRDAAVSPASGRR